MPRTADSRVYPRLIFWAAALFLMWKARTHGLPTRYPRLLKDFSPLRRWTESYARLSAGDTPVPAWDTDMDATDQGASFWNRIDSLAARAIERIEPYLRPSESLPRRLEVSLAGFTMHPDPSSPTGPGRYYRPSGRFSFAGVDLTPREAER